MDERKGGGMKEAKAIISYSNSMETKQNVSYSENHCGGKETLETDQLSFL